ncbi:MAG: BatA domain-containing protein, partial [Verrucomicrobiota bacterium]
MQPLVFENPLGFGALVGIPALLLIHCLRQQKKRRRVTTLFLLQEIAEDQPTGRQWASLRSSLPLWLQLLSVLLLTIILVGPRWKAADSVKQAAFVLDGTASIRAFLPELRQRKVGRAGSYCRLVTKLPLMLAFGLNLAGSCAL